MGGPNLRLREARLAAGLTQEQLAKLAGIPAGTYRPIESGHRGGNLRTLTRIARALGRTVDELFATMVDADRDESLVSQHNATVRRTRRPHNERVA